MQGYNNIKINCYQAIHPGWMAMRKMYGNRKINHEKDRVTENKIMRLVFHDCVKYKGIEKTTYEKSPKNHNQYHRWHRRL